MSHIAEIKTELKDLEAVKAACKELGLTFHEGQKTCAFYPTEAGAQQHPCDHAIGLPVGDYKMELGLTKQANGTFSLVGDNLLQLAHTDDSGDYWCKRIFGRETNPLGSKFGTFIQHYAVHKATIEARKRGYMVNRVAGKNGAIQLVVTGIK